MNYISISSQSRAIFVAVDGDCKFLVLNRSDFMEVLAESPEILKTMRQIHEAQLTTLTL